MRSFFQHDAHTSIRCRHAAFFGVVDKHTRVSCCRYGRRPKVLFPSVPLYSGGYGFELAAYLRAALPVFPFDTACIAGSKTNSFISSLLKNDQPRCAAPSGDWYWKPFCAHTTDRLMQLTAQVMSELTYRRSVLLASLWC